MKEDADCGGDKTCYYELFECMAGCEESICPKNACLGEEGESIIESVTSSNSACKSLET
jgi:hypothetical protein